MQTADSSSLIAAHRAAQETAKALTDGLSEAQLLWSPGQDVWSLAQQFDHQNRAGYAMPPLLSKAVASLKADGKRSEKPFRPNFLERFFISAVSPGAKFQSPVPPLFEPASEPAAVADALPRFLALQDAFIACVESADGFDLGGVTIVSPANSLLRLRLGAWFIALPAHQEYHLSLAKKLRSDAKFPM